MSLVFNGLELGAIFLAVLIAQAVTHEGESTWFEGAQLLAVYVVLGLHLLLRRLMLLSWAALGGDHGPPAVGRPALLRARPRAELPRGRDLEHRLARRVAARRRVAAAARHPRARRLRHLHDRLLRRALAVARQPVRVRPAVRVLRGADRVPRAAAVLRHRGGARAARRRRSSAASRCCRSCTSSSTCSACCCSSSPTGSCAGWRRTSTPTATSSCGWCGGCSRSRSDFEGKRLFVQAATGTRFVTPLFVCLAAIVAADIAFAVDSIPAAFAITRDSVLIWMANIFALLGLRALFVLVEGLIRRFRYLDETIAIVLALVAAKLLLEDVYKVGPELTLVVVFVAFAIGIAASLMGRPPRPGRRGEARRAVEVDRLERRAVDRRAAEQLPAGGRRGRPRVVLEAGGRRRPVGGQRAVALAARDRVPGVDLAVERARRDRRTSATCSGPAPSTRRRARRARCPSRRGGSR